MITLPVLFLLVSRLDFICMNRDDNPGGISLLEWNNKCQKLFKDHGELAATMTYHISGYCEEYVCQKYSKELYKVVVTDCHSTKKRDADCVNELSAFPRCCDEELCLERRSTNISKTAAKNINPSAITANKRILQIMQPLLLGHTKLSNTDITATQLRPAWLLDIIKELVMVIENIVKHLRGLKNYFNDGNRRQKDQVVTKYIPARGTVPNVSSKICKGKILRCLSQFLIYITDDSDESSNEINENKQNHYEKVVSLENELKGVIRKKTAQRNLGNSYTNTQVTGAGRFLRNNLYNNEALLKRDNVKNFANQEDLREPFSQLPVDYLQKRNGRRLGMEEEPREFKALEYNFK